MSGAMQVDPSDAPEAASESEVASLPPAILPSTSYVVLPDSTRPTIPATIVFADFLRFPPPTPSLPTSSPSSTAQTGSSALDRENLNLLDVLQPYSPPSPSTLSSEEEKDPLASLPAGMVARYALTFSPILGVIAEADWELKELSQIGGEPLLVFPPDENEEADEKEVPWRLGGSEEFPPDYAQEVKEEGKEQEEGKEKERLWSIAEGWVTVKRGEEEGGGWETRCLRDGEEVRFVMQYEEGAEEVERNDEEGMKVNDEPVASTSAAAADDDDKKPSSSSSPPLPVAQPSEPTAPGLLPSSLILGLIEERYMGPATEKDDENFSNLEQEEAQDEGAGEEQEGVE
ncbi:hypothetical protein JCM8547_004297 [Rhodosporidiobolus lusitaniae]